MTNDRANLFRLLLCAALLVLPACITTEGRVFTSEADPKEALEARVTLARGYIGEGNWEDAKRNLRLAADIDPNSPDVHEAFALVYQSTGEYELAEQSFKKALSLRPNFSRARNNYAAFLYSQGEYQKAEAELTIVTKDTLYESRPQAFINLGLCQVRLKKLDAAKVSFTRALTMDRTNQIAMLEMANIEFEQENWPQSQRYFDNYRQVVRRLPARALWLGIRLADKLENDNARASMALALRNMYPQSAEFQAYERAVQSGGL